MYAQIIDYSKNPIEYIDVEAKQNVTPKMAALPFGIQQQYGKKIPTAYMVRFNNRWYRVYSAIFSNIGTNYIVSAGEKITVEIYN